MFSSRHTCAAHSFSSSYFQSAPFLDYGESMVQGGVRKYTLSYSCSQGPNDGNRAPTDPHQRIWRKRDTFLSSCNRGHNLLTHTFHHGAAPHGIRALNPANAKRWASCSIVDDVAQRRTTKTKMTHPARRRSNSDFSSKASEHGGG